MSKQRLLFITTGGTIASVRTQQGLKPVLSSEELLAHLPELKELCCPETLALCSIDSTDLGQEHWLMMARAIQENYALYDGFIICHGTDTLAYSAAALSYLIQNADKPIILTGAQQPISNEITDAKKNLRDSVVCAIDPGSRGVMVVFGGHVIAGTRAKKNKTISYDAFASVNFPELALVQGDRLVRYIPSPWPTGPVEFSRTLDSRVFLLKLTPGMSPALIPEIFRLYDCVIVESFRRGRHPAAADGRLCRRAGRLRDHPQGTHHDHAGHLRGQRRGRVRGGQAGAQPLPLFGSPRYDHRGRSDQKYVAAGTELRKL